ncbi:MAG: pyruvate ferredoxin oxidoreductase [Chloroflexi bacterium]|nr:pyruvate ferredoxin oxidoreductase [Chloroflexota bacterium]
MATPQTIVKGKAVALNGAGLVAQAMRQANPDVVAVYPITPQTLIVEAYSQFVADGEVTTELVHVESEHAALSACIGAAAAGARTQTATAGPGLALMWEVLFVASGMRLPLVMHMANRTFSAPLNILCDHSDAMGSRDASWVQVFAENGQEAYDNALQAVRIAEHRDVLLPVMTCLDGYVLSHGTERAEVLPDEAARSFLGSYTPKHPLLDLEHPVTHGANTLADYQFEIKYQQVQAMEHALRVVQEVGESFGQLTGRAYGLVEPYRLEDAEVAIVVMGSTAGTAKVAVDDLREQGIKAGLLKVRCFRPFPGEAIVQALAHLKAVAVMDRALSFGAEGHPLYLEVCTALFQRGLHLPMLNYVFGIGGRDTIPQHIVQVYQDLLRVAQKGLEGRPVRYLALRE